MSEERDTIIIRAPYDNGFSDFECRYQFSIGLDEIDVDAVLEMIALMFDGCRGCHEILNDTDVGRPAALLGGLAFLKDRDRVLVFTIVDAKISGFWTWTPSPEEDAYIEDKMSTAAGRIRLAHECIGNGCCKRAVQIGLYHENDAKGSTSLLGFTALPVQQLRFPGGLIPDELFDMTEMLPAGDEDDGDIPYDDPVSTDARKRHYPEFRADQASGRTCPQMRMKRRMKMRLNCREFLDLIEECRPLAGQVVLLYGTNLARLHGVACDEDDFYYIVEENSAQREYWASAVGGIVGIKGLLGEHYDVIDRDFTMNGAPARHFEVMHQDDSGNRTFVEGGPPDEMTLNQVSLMFEKHLDTLFRDDYGLKRIVWDAWEGFVDRQKK